MGEKSGLMPSDTREDFWCCVLFIKFLLPKWQILYNNCILQRSVEQNITALTCLLLVYCVNHMLSAGLQCQMEMIFLFNGVETVSKLWIAACQQCAAASLQWWYLD